MPTKWRTPCCPPARSQRSVRPPAFFFSSRRRHTRFDCDWSSDVCSSDLLAATGATLVHPYADAAVIAGQGTAALELLAAAGPLDALVVPVGGGGLAAGTRSEERRVGKEWRSGCGGER